MDGVQRPYTDGAYLASQWMGCCEQYCSTMCARAHICTHLHTCVVMTSSDYCSTPPLLAALQSSCCSISLKTITLATARHTCCHCNFAFELQAAQPGTVWLTKQLHKRGFPEFGTILASSAYVSSTTGLPHLLLPATWLCTGLRATLHACCCCCYCFRLAALKMQSRI